MMSVKSAQRPYRAILWHALLGSVALITLLSFLTSLHDSFASVGIDLRLNIAEARLLREGLNPYSVSYQSNPRFAQGLIFEHGPGPGAYDPALLMMYMPLCELPQRLQRHIWWGLEWLALGVSVLILTRRMPNPLAVKSLLICSLLFFASSTFWRLHTERGKSYVFLLLLISFSWWLLSGTSRWRWAYVIPLGIAAAYRPSFAITGLVLLCLGRVRDVVGFGITVAILVVATFPFGGPQLWKDFSINIIEITRSMESPAYGRQHYGDPIGPFKTEEGIVFQGADPDIRSINFSFPKYIHRAFVRITRKEDATDLDAPMRQAQILLILLTAMMVPILFLLRNRFQSSTAVMILLSTAAITADLFAPVRFSYADIVFLLPLALIFALSAEMKTRSSVLALTIALTGLIISSGYWGWLSPTATERVRPIFLLVSLWLGCLSFAITRRDQSASSFTRSDDVLPTAS